MRRVRFTATAQDQVARERDWWLENRDNQEAFATDIARALEIVSVLPGIGTPYAARELPGVRRVFLRRIACHLY